MHLRIDRCMWNPRDVRIQSNKDNSANTANTYTCEIRRFMYLLHCSSISLHAVVVLTTTTLCISFALERKLLVSPFSTALQVKDAGKFQGAGQGLDLIVTGPRVHLPIKTNFNMSTSDNRWGNVLPLYYL